MNGYEWTEEVYKIVKQLNYMQKINPKEYYKKWVQAKINRLKVVGKPIEGLLEKLQQIDSKIITTEK